MRRTLLVKVSLDCIGDWEFLVCMYMGFRKIGVFGLPGWIERASGKVIGVNGYKEGCIMTLDKIYYVDHLVLETTSQPIFPKIPFHPAHHLGFPGRAGLSCDINHVVYLHASP